MPPHNTRQARDKLKECRNKIDEEKLMTSEDADSFAGILTASDPKDWHRIKCFAEKKVKNQLETNVVVKDRDVFFFHISSY